MKESITITDNRSGESIEIPIEDGGVDSGPWTKFLPGLWFKDEGFAATAVTNSSITYIDGGAGQLEYRGYPIEDLASKSTFTEVAYLLVHGELPNSESLDDWNSKLAEHAQLDAVQNENLLNCFSSHSHPMGMFTAGLAALSTLYPDAKDVEDPETRQKHVLNAIAKVSTLASSAAAYRNGYTPGKPNEELSYVENFLSMTFSTSDKVFEPNPTFVKALDQLFILHADHEQNCSTTAVRVVGSSHADPYSALSAGSAALSGPRHGGANEAVLNMLDDIGTFENVNSFVDSVKNGEGRLMGFGHRVYKNYDPRAQIIKDTAHEIFELTGKNPKLDIALKLEEAALEDDYFVSRKLYPNVDFYSGLIYQAMGFPVEMFTVLFAVARTAGWISHWDEMLSRNTRIARPRQLYIGSETRNFISIEDR
ncbi:MAG: citrate (Si)-synthase [Acidimicrobiaceae bacterium]|nr:citrate (Si)-synthase [Acidimicrobiaceae bacterium]